MFEPRSRHTLGAATALAAGLILSGCGAGSSIGGGTGPVEAVETPAAAGSLAPNLFAGDDDRVYMSWLESTGGSTHALRFAVWDGGAWSEPGTIREADDFWVNWADFPSLVLLPDGRLAAHWLQRSGPGTYDYDVHITVSADGGATWGESLVPHRDGTLSEHGFVSLFPSGDGGLTAVWLDGRDFAGSGHGGHGAADGHDPEMSLRKTVIGVDGSLGPEVLLDGRVCDCCQTAAALTSEGPVIVYRDRSPEEIRDISIIRRVDGRWSEPAPVHVDGWRIPACPVNGPAIAAAGRRVAVAWFSAARDTARVLVAFSDDAGASFASPVRVDDGDPAGRVAVLLRSDGSALVSWLEQTRAGAEIRVRTVGAGERGRAITVAASSAARASGFPRMVRNGEQLVFAWTEAGRSPRVRVATAPASAL